MTTALNRECTTGAPALLALLLALGGCHHSGGGSSGPLVNLGVGVLFAQANGELMVLGVSEFAEGQRDRNGDGDLLDIVVTVYDLGDGSLTDLGLAILGLLAAGDGLVAIGVPETNQGATDLNGDGDTNDTVLHVYDSVTRVSTNTGLALTSPPVIGAGGVAFLVSESAQGNMDLDGSGTAVGSVLHVYDASTQLATNAGRSATSTLTFHDHALGFTTSEADAGADLNGDGDSSDTNVFQLFDLVLGGLEEVPLAIRGRPLAVGTDDWYLLADEDSQEADLNGDGDQDDGVYFAVAPPLGTQTPIGFSSADSFTSLAHEDLLALIVQEIDGMDHNIDGDLDDAFVALVRPAGAPIVLSEFPVSIGTPLAFAGGELAYLVNEFIADSDLDGDTVLDDEFLFATDVLAGVSTNLLLDALTVQGAGERFLFPRNEGIGGEDWTGDGDMDDIVFWVRDATSGVTHNVGLAQINAPAASSAFGLLVLAAELGQNRDMNGDGDLFDFVWARHDFASMLNQELGVAGLDSPAALLDDGRGALFVFENGQDFAGASGQDLNGDGDVDDFVLHALRAP